MKSPETEIFSFFFKIFWRIGQGPVAQLAERYICNVEVTGSIPVRSTEIVNN